MTDQDLAARYGTDPAGTMRQIARAEARDAAALIRPAQIDRPGVRVSPQTMDRMAEIYADRAGAIRPWLFWLCFAGGIIIYAIAFSNFSDWVPSW